MKSRGLGDVYKRQLKKEGLSNKSFLVGDPMYDAFDKYSKMLNIEDIKLKTLLGEEIEPPKKFYYLTCHREENTKDDETLLEIFKAMNDLDYPTIYPVHPRNKERALRISDLHSFKTVSYTHLTLPTTF